MNSLRLTARIIKPAAKLMWVLAQVDEKMKNSEMSQSDIVTFVRRIFERDLVGEMTATES